MAKVVGRLATAVKRGAAGLKAEYEAGKRGDDGPVQPLWASPKEQLDAVVALLRSSRDATAERAPAPVETVGDDETTETVGDDETTVTVAMRGVDWAAVRAATSERGADATRVMRAMADQVDWTKVQPVAGQVTSALIAAVASGHLPVGGSVGSTVARAIVDQGGLGQRVTKQMTDAGAPLPPDFRGVIDTSAVEVDVARPPERGA